MVLNTVTYTDIKLSQKSLNILLVLVFQSQNQAQSDVPIKAHLIALARYVETLTVDENCRGKNLLNCGYKLYRVGDVQASAKHSQSFSIR